MNLNLPIINYFCAFCAFLWLLLFVLLCGLTVLDAEGAHTAIEVASVDAHEFGGA